jgi:hypothetical protein
MPLSAPRVLPWATWDAWYASYVSLETYISGGLAGALPPALQSLAASCALRGRVPLAVGSTLTLLHHLRPPPGGCPAAHDAALGLCLLRLVNGVADSGQGGAFAASVAELARRAGLPRWLVDLRHDLTHGAQPEGSVVRAAAAHALAWLLVRYWRPQAALVGTQLGVGGGGGGGGTAVAEALAAYARAGEGGAGEGVAAGAGKGSPGGAAAAPLKRARGAPPPPPTTPAPAAAGSGPRLIHFSPALLRGVLEACDGRAERLLCSPAPPPLLARAAVALQASAAPAPPLSNLLEPRAATRCAPLVALAREGAAPPWRRFAWVRVTLVPALVACLTAPPAPAPAPHAAGGLPSHAAHAAPSFRTWAPLLHALDVALPGTARLVALQLALVAGGEGAALADAWLWLLRTRYWASLGEWSLAVAPPRSCSGGGGGGGAPAPAARLLHACRKWSREEAAWAFSPAPPAAALGLAVGGGGRAGVRAEAALAPLLAAAAVTRGGAVAGGGGGAPLLDTGWYAAALAAPCLPLFPAPRAAAAHAGASAPPAPARELDLDELERLLDAGGRGAQRAVEAAAAEEEVEGGALQPLPSRPRWFL